MAGEVAIRRTGPVGAYAARLEPGQTVRRIEATVATRNAPRRVLGRVWTCPERADTSDVGVSPRGAAAVTPRGPGAPRGAGHPEAGSGFLRDGDPMSRYRFVEAEKGRYPVTQLCRMAEVSRAAYYQWQEGRGSARQAADAALTAAIRAIHAASRGQYGVPRVLAELRAQGHDVGRKRVARLMAAAGLRGR